MHLCVEVSDILYSIWSMLYRQGISLVVRFCVEFGKLCIFFSLTSWILYSSCVENCTLCTVHISLHSLHSKLDHFYTILGCDNWINYSLRLRVQHSAYSNYYVTITVQSSCDDIYFRRYSTVLITERNSHLKRKHYLATIGFYRWRWLEVLNTNHTIWSNQWLINVAYYLCIALHWCILQ